MKVVKFDNIKYINYEINPVIKNIWYNDNELHRMNMDFLREITVISQLNNCTLKHGLTLWKKNMEFNK
jgi:hypothetical protein